MIITIQMNIRILSNIEEFESVYPLMIQLRTHLSLNEFLEYASVANQMDQYTLVGAYEKEACIGLMGMRINVDMVRGKHIYIDDLVVDEETRSKGVGGKLLAFAEDFATKNNCKVLRLCTGIQNEKGKSFYERNNWRQTAIAYTKRL